MSEEERPLGDETVRQVVWPTQKATPAPTPAGPPAEPLPVAAPAAPPASTSPGAEETVVRARPVRLVGALTLPREEELAREDAPPQLVHWGKWLRQVLPGLWMLTIAAWLAQGVIGLGGVPVEGVVATVYSAVVAMTVPVTIVTLLLTALLTIAGPFFPEAFE